MTEWLLVIIFLGADFGVTAKGWNTRAECESMKAQVLHISPSVENTPPIQAIYCVVRQTTQDKLASNEQEHS